MVQPLVDELAKILARLKDVEQAAMYEAEKAKCTNGTVQQEFAVALYKIESAINMLKAYLQFIRGE